jgi:hypothetical protein
VYFLGEIMTSKLKEFLAAQNGDQSQDFSNFKQEPKEEPKEDYNTIVRQLSSISWQLKRIADALESR